MPPPEGVTIRPARDEHWPAITALQVDGAGDAREASFRRWQMRGYRRLLDRCPALWWVALRDGEVAGSAGLFGGAKLARYQQVAVAPEHRRRGVTAALVSAIA